LVCCALARDRRCPIWPLPLERRPACVPHANPNRLGPIDENTGAGSLLWQDTPIDVPADSNVEMTWPVFAGEHHELYLALLKEHCHADGVELSDKELNRQFRLHLHRGIGYLATPNTIRSIGDLVGVVVEHE
jgi:hypothetical protein